MKITRNLCVAAIVFGSLAEGVQAHPEVKEVAFQRADGVVCKVSLSVEKLTGPVNIWGAEGVRPATLASGLRASCKDGAVSVPREAFFDLGNPLRLAVELVDQGYDIVINGAHGPLAYVARLHVEGQAVVERDVASVTVPEMAEHVSYREEGS